MFSARAVARPGRCAGRTLWASRGPGERHRASRSGRSAPRRQAHWQIVEGGAFPGGSTPGSGMRKSQFSGFSSGLRRAPLNPSGSSFSQLRTGQARSSEEDRCRAVFLSATALTTLAPSLRARRSCLCPVIICVLASEESYGNQAFARAGLGFFTVLCPLFVASVLLISSSIPAIPVST
jgi:hypothetical protein